MKCWDDVSWHLVVSEIEFQIRCIHHQYHISTNISSLLRASFNPPTQTIGLPNRPCPTTSSGLRQPSINNGPTTKNPIRSTTRPCHFTSTAPMIPYGTTPPRHRLRISTRTRRTAGRPLRAATVGANRLGKPAGPVATTHPLLPALLPRLRPARLKLMVKAMEWLL